MKPTAPLRAAILAIALATELFAQSATSGSPIDEARRAAIVALVPQLEQLAQTCERKKLLRERDRVYRQILHFDPDHAAARKALKFKRDASGGWQQDSYQEPRDASDKELASYAKDRRSALAPGCESLRKLLTSTPPPPPEQSAMIAEDLLLLDPEDAAAHQALGDVKEGALWLLRDTIAARARRAELRTLARQALETTAEPDDAEASSLEASLAVKWTKVVQEPDVRVLGTGDTDEIVLIARANQAAGPFFRSVFQVEAKFWPSYTLYVLAHDGEREVVVSRHPSANEEQRKYLLSVNSGGFPGTSQWGHWGPDQARRLDSSARSTLGCFLGDTFGVGPAHGWVWEGLGLYLTRELIGTRLTSFAGAAPRDQASLLERMRRADTSWMNEAHELLRTGKNPPLATVLGKDVAAMGPADVLMAYALAAYLLEARADHAASVLRRIGGSEPAADVLASELGLSPPTLEARLERWLGERH